MKAYNSARSFVGMLGSVYFAGATKKSLVLLVILVGCSTPDKTNDSYARALVRTSDRASDFYSQGSVDQAIREYQEVLRQAWLTDNEYEAGTAAYHLAACYFSSGETRVAKDWLLDARHELLRAGSSCRNVWLLDAKIARTEQRYQDIPYLLKRASEEVDVSSMDSESDRLSQILFTSLGSVSGNGQLVRAASFRSRKHTEQLDNVPILLIEAAVAVEKKQFLVAKRHLTEAEKILGRSDHLELQAEWNRISGELAMEMEQYSLAAQYFDQEVSNLKAASQFLDLHKVFSQSAEAYEKEGEYARAADRLCRAARSCYGREDYQLAWQIVQDAGVLAQRTQNATIQTRLSLLAELILLALPGDPQEAPTDG